MNPRWNPGLTPIRSSGPFRKSVYSVMKSRDGWQAWSRVRSFTWQGDKFRSNYTGWVGNFGFRIERIGRDNLPGD